MTKLSFTNIDGRLAYLAIVYHLGRPGSEIDALTLEPHELGLGPARVALEQQIQLAVAEIDLSEYQLSRLGEALLGTINELKQYELSGGRSTVPKFTQTMNELFPNTSTESGASLDLARQTMMLRRRLDAAVRNADAAVDAAREVQVREHEAKNQRWWSKWKMPWKN